MVAYCTPNDLVLGNIPLPSYMNAEQKIQDAADEIDSSIGYVYQTPLDVTETGPLKRPARLFLKRLNAHLASGRILLAIASPQEQTSLHAYAWSLVNESLKAIEAIRTGEAPLEGAPPAEGAAEGEAVTVPLIHNVDPESNVEAFYDRVVNPDFIYGIHSTRPSADRLLW